MLKFLCTVCSIFVICFFIKACGNTKPATPTTPLTQFQEKEFKTETQNLLAVLTVLETAQAKTVGIYDLNSYLSLPRSFSRRSLSVEWLGLATESREGQIRSLIREAFKNGYCSLNAPKALIKQANKKMAELWGLVPQELEIKISGARCPFESLSKTSVQPNREKRELRATTEFKIKFTDESLQKLVGLKSLDYLGAGELNVADPVTKDISVATAQIKGSMHTLQKGVLNFWTKADGSGMYGDENETKIQQGKGEIAFYLGLHGFSAELNAKTIVMDGKQSDVFSLNSQLITQAAAADYLKLK